MSRNLGLGRLFDEPEHKAVDKKKTDKEEREERKRAKLQFEREVYAAANERGISRNMITIGQKKSIPEIIAAAERVTGKKVQVVEGIARTGDPAMLTASADKFNRVAASWRHFALDDMIQHAWNWYVRKDH
jgi:hypothetical protein